MVLILLYSTVKLYLLGLTPGCLSEYYSNSSPALLLIYPPNGRPCTECKYPPANPGDEIAAQQPDEGMGIEIAAEGEVLPQQQPAPNLPQQGQAAPQEGVSN